MKNIRKFETTADMEAAALEDVSVTYNAETDGLLSMPLKPNIKNYMRFVAVEDSQINLMSVIEDTGEADNSVDLKHSKDGLTWTQYDFNPIPLAAGETLYLKGDNENGFSCLNGETGKGRVCVFGDTSVIGIPSTPSTGKFECHGNIMSLLYGDDFEDKTTIPNLGCFVHLFTNCSGLTTAPELPATALAERCYCAMFALCTGLTTAPELPATMLPDGCYESMFSYCTNLNHIKMLATDISANYCLENWVRGVSSAGTFVKHPDMTSLSTDEDGIPNGWTVEDAVL